MAKKILVVDDEPVIVKMLSTRLTANGYDVIQAHSGEEALKVMESNVPDLVVMDVTMPPPNGYQVCRTIKDDERFKLIPVLLLTAKTSESDKFWGMEAGADVYMTKPYNSEDLLKKIQGLL